jgi:citrate lyase subunit beta-like protein
MATNVVRRALLYVPASSQKFLDKSRGLVVDSVAYDLEDSVTPGKKVEARRNLRQFLEQPRSKSILEQAVRINSVDSGLALDDLTEVVQSPLISISPSAP